MHPDDLPPSVQRLGNRCGGLDPVPRLFLEESQVPIDLYIHIHTTNIYVYDVGGDGDKNNEKTIMAYFLFYHLEVCHSIPLPPPV